MSGRGHGRGPRGQRRGEGRGRHTPPANHARHDREPKFKGVNPDLPTLNFGASVKENKPIEFLQLMGEYILSISSRPFALPFGQVLPTSDQKKMNQ
jgi:hypothetical protein